VPRIALPAQLDSDTRDTLNEFVRSSSTPQSLAPRSRIILAAAGGSTNQQIATALQVPAIAVGKWRRSFAVDGIEGLRDAPRSGRPPKHNFAVRQTVQTRVCRQPGILSRQGLSPSVPRPKGELKEYLLLYLKRYRENPRPFTWTKGPEKLQRIVEAAKE